MAVRLSAVGVAVVLASGWSVAAHQATPSAPAGRTPRSGMYSDAQAARGEPLYTAECAFCHGQDLQGTFAAPPLTQAALSARWQKKTLKDLLDYQQAFMPWTSPGGYSRQQNIDILAYILKKGGFPAGADLPSSPDALRQIVLR